MEIKKSYIKFINRIINKIFVISKNEKLRRYCLIIATKMFKNPKNNIEFDKENNWYWLKKGNKYLQFVKRPYFDFSEKEMNQRCLQIFCKYYLPRVGDLIIDIGAGIGTEICFFEDRIKNQGKLYNIEASPSNFYGLQQVTKKNKFKNCYNFNFALSNNNEPIWMEENENYVVNKINKEAKGLKIEAITLDQFVIINQIKKINLLKVNIEGAEYDMIDGMKESAKIIVNIAISCHDFLFNKKQNIKNKVVLFLKENNFEIFYEDSGNEVLDSWIYGKKVYDFIN